jgi:NADPH:quinone reductase-like Zn-dependent oxidoreductase
MKAAILGDAGIEVGEVQKPVPKPNEVLVRVRATTLNRADLLVASGHQHGAVGGKGRGSVSNAPARSRRSAARSRASRPATA